MSDFKNEVRKGRENRESWISRAFGLGGSDKAEAQESSSQRQRETAQSVIDRARNDKAAENLNLDKNKLNEFVKGFRRGK
jgi:hypothetical protein